MRRTRLLAMMILATLCGGFAAAAHAAPVTSSWIGTFDLTRQAWHGGAAVQLIVSFAMPPDAGAACFGPPDANAVFLTAPVDAQHPQSTGGAFPTPGGTFYEPAHDDVLPDPVATGPDAAAVMCGYFLVPSGDSSRVKSRESTTVPEDSPLRVAAYAVDVAGDGRFQLLNESSTARAAIAAGLVTPVPIGPGGRGWIAACDQTASAAHHVLRARGPGEVLCGSAGADVLVAASDDVLVGFGGDDLLLGGSGGDILLGGAGNDKLVAGSGAELLYGGTGNTLLADDGHNVLIGNRSSAQLVGGLLSDALIGGATSNQLQGHPDSPFATLPRSPETDYCVAPAGATITNCTVP